VSVDRTPGTYFHVLEDRLRLLYVDDDPILREFAVVHLSSANADVVTAGDGEEALQRLAEAEFDLMLLDLEMPRMDGFATLQAIQAEERLRALPVIVVTGREDVMAIDRAFLEGATSFSSKPINWRLLSYEIRYVYRNHKAQAALRRARDQAREAGERAMLQLRELAAAGEPLLHRAMAGDGDLREAAQHFGRSLISASKAA
jgi:CheY-like chemotaxis protein